MLSSLYGRGPPPSASGRGTRVGHTSQTAKPNAPCRRLRTRECPACLVEMAGVFGYFRFGRLQYRQRCADESQSARESGALWVCYTVLR